MDALQQMVHHQHAKWQYDGSRHADLKWAACPLTFRDLKIDILAVAEIADLKVAE